MTCSEMITASKTWTCPKAGRWKIICVGGGASGGVLNGDDGSVTQNAGGTTSFGNILSAAGGKKETYPSGKSGVDSGAKSCGGYGGYTGVAYGGAGAYKSGGGGIASSSINGGSAMGQPGLGYGAGGGVLKAAGTTEALPGKCGEIKSIELDLTVNQSIACTIGTGGASFAEATTSITAGNSGVIVVRFIQ